MSHLKSAKGMVEVEGSENGNGGFSYARTLMPFRNSAASNDDARRAEPTQAATSF